MWDPSIPDLQGRADSWRWDSLKRHINCYSPQKYQAILHLIHEGHFGLGKCKLRAKDIVYWTGLNEDLEKLILNCELCLEYSHSKCKQKPSQSLGQGIPVYPWTKLATGIFHFKNSSYLLQVDYTSRLLVVCKLSSMTGQHFANLCKQVFSEYGLSETLISDNGLCYTSQAFTSVMQSYSVNHITRSLHYQQSIGLAEKYVQIVKSLFYKAMEVRQRFLQVPDDLSQYPTLQVACNHLCRFSRVGLLDLTCLCQMVLGNSLLYSLQ